MIRSQMASARVGSYRFSCHSLVSYWEQKMVDAALFLASTEDGGADRKLNSEKEETTECIRKNRKKLC